jgi:D-hydroxyproline dehydrogenase subunit gamma
VTGDRRIDTHGVVQRGTKVTFTIDDVPTEAFAGETVAAALYAGRQRILRYTSRSSSARGVYCGMGVCFDCLVEINGRPNIRACMTPVQEGMTVRTQVGPSDPVSPVPNWGSEDAD